MSQDPTSQPSQPSPSSSTPKKGHRRVKSWGLPTPPALPPTEEQEDPLSGQVHETSTPTPPNQLDISAPPPSTSSSSSSSSSKLLTKLQYSFGKGKNKKKKKGHNRSLSWGANKEVEVTNPSPMNNGASTPDPDQNLYSGVYDYDSSCSLTPDTHTSNGQAGQCAVSVTPPTPSPERTSKKTSPPSPGKSKKKS